MLEIINLEQFKDRISSCTGHSSYNVLVNNLFSGPRFYKESITHVSKSKALSIIEHYDQYFKDNTVYNDYNNYKGVVSYKVIDNRIFRISYTHMDPDDENDCQDLLLEFIYTNIE